MTFGDNALFRHPEIVKRVTRWKRIRPSCGCQAGSTIGLDGNIACLVNGSLAMSTMDINITAASPFFGVGARQQGAGHQAFAFCSPTAREGRARQPLQHREMRHDRHGHSGCLQSRLSWPLVVRLEGTNVGLGRKLRPKAA